MNCQLHWSCGTTLKLWYYVVVTVFHILSVIKCSWLVCSSVLVHAAECSGINASDRAKQPTEIISSRPASLRVICTIVVTYSLSCEYLTFFCETAMVLQLTLSCIYHCVRDVWTYFSFSEYGSLIIFSLDACVYMFPDDPVCLWCWSPWPLLAIAHYLCIRRSELETTLTVPCPRCRQTHVRQALFSYDVIQNLFSLHWNTMRSRWHEYWRSSKWVNKNHDKFF